MIDHLRATWMMPRVAFENVCAGLIRPKESLALLIISWTMSILSCLEFCTFSAVDIALGLRHHPGFFLVNSRAHGDGF